MGLKVCAVQSTPNPNAKKFVLDRCLWPQPLSFKEPGAAAGDSLARQLFGVNGVVGVFLANDFVTVNKRADARWPAIANRVQEILQKWDPEGR